MSDTDKWIEIVEYNKDKSSPTLNFPILGSKVRCKNTKMYKKEEWTAWYIDCEHGTFYCTSCEGEQHAFKPTHFRYLKEEEKNEWISLKE